MRPDRSGGLRGLAFLSSDPISRRLTDAEIAALAAYYGAPPSPAPAASSGKPAADKKK